MQLPYIYKQKTFVPDVFLTHMQPQISKKHLLLFIYAAYLTDNVAVSI